ncbi:hypothetical protein D3C73_756960 [compost metagenome]
MLFASSKRRVTKARPASEMNARIAIAIRNLVFIFRFLSIGYLHNAMNSAH